MVIYPFKKYDFPYFFVCLPEGTTGACAPAPPADSPSRPKKIAHPAAPRRNKVGLTLGLAIYIYDI